MLEVWICDDNKRMALITGGFIEKVLAKRGEKFGLDFFFNGNEIIDILNKDNRAPDILFLALQMKECDGISVLKSFTEKYCSTLIVLLSAYEDVLPKIIKYKPFACIMKEKMNTEIPYFIEKALLRFSVKKTGKLSITSNGLSLEIPESRIMYIICCNKMVEIFTIDGKKFVVRGTLEKMADSFNDSFVLINRGLLINLAYVTKVCGKEVIMNGDNTFLCSRSRLKEFKEVWKKHRCLEKRG